MNTPTIIRVVDLQPGDVVLWTSKYRLIEAVDKSFAASITVKLNDLFQPEHWPPMMELLRFGCVATEVD